MAPKTTTETSKFEVSIIIRTTPGREQLLNNALASVNGQSATAGIHAIIICDGGSDDRSSELRSAFQKIEITYVPTKKRVGRSEAANIGLRAVQSRFVNILDDDDIFYANHVATLSNFLNNNPDFDAVYAGSDAAKAEITYDKDSAEIDIKSQAYHFQKIRSSFEILNVNPFPIQAVMFRSSLLTPDTFFDAELEALEDWLFWHILLIGHQIYGLDTSTSRYYLPWRISDTRKRLAVHERSYETFHRKRSSIRISLPLIYDLTAPQVIGTNFPNNPNTFEDALIERLRLAVRDPRLVFRFIKRLISKAREQEPYAGPLLSSAISIEHKQRIETFFADQKNNHSAPSAGKYRNVVYTSVNRAYLDKAMNLGRSLKQHNPDTAFHIVYADYLDESLYEHIVSSGFVDHVHPANKLNIPEFQKWAFKRSVVEFCTGVKPHYLRMLLEAGYDRVVYIDPDCQVYSSLDPVFESIDKGSLSLTPHCRSIGITQFQIDKHELSALAHGLFNLGYIGVKNNAVGEQVANYWIDRCDKFGFDEIHRGMFTDQKLFDLAVFFFPNLDILNHPGVNIASWNIEGITLDNTDGAYTANGEPIVFFHFSGFDRGVPSTIGESLSSTKGVLRQLIQEYTASVEEADAALPLSTEAWILSEFDNGQKIIGSFRVCYRQHDDLQLAFPHPFMTTEKNTYWDWIAYKGYENIRSKYDRSVWLPRFY